jgi:hypothetical protein
MKKQPYHARVNERHFLNLPGHHAGAFVNCYIEDTSDRGLIDDRYSAGRKYNPQPRMMLQIADCCDTIDLEFGSAKDRQNSFHKIDTLIAALQAFRDGMADECALYRQRQRELDALKEQEAEDKRR